MPETWPLYCSEQSSPECTQGVQRHRCPLPDSSARAPRSGGSSQATQHSLPQAPSCLPSEWNPASIPLLNLFLFIYYPSVLLVLPVCVAKKIFTRGQIKLRAHTSIHNTSCSFCSQQKSCSLVHPGGRAVHAWHTQVVLAYSVITFALEMIPEKQTTVVPPHSQGTGSLQLKSVCNVPYEAK